MPGRLTKFSIELVDGKCFNTMCDVKSYCRRYSKEATNEQRDQFKVIPCEHCKLFTDTTQIVKSNTPIYKAQY